MNRFLTHEAVASNLLNANFCSAAGVHLPWQHHLTNNDRVLELLVRRMDADWCALAPKMRKAWSPATLDAQHCKFHFETFENNWTKAQHKFPFPS